MKLQRRVRSSPGDLHALARCAATSVPIGLSARRGTVRRVAPFLVPFCLVAPFLGTPGELAVMVLVGLAIVIRTAALVFVVVGRGRPADPVPAVLPTVTVLLPLRDEAAVVEPLVRSICRLSYPRERMDVIALIEDDDPDTLAAFLRHAPRDWRVVSLPAGQPQTKPRACNVGLDLSRGEILVVFDGEDRPDADQALKAVAALAANPALAVVQARLGCDHARPGAPLLARFWAMEYAVLFGAIQPVLARAGLPFLFGGTSNWFRTSVLRDVGGWDAHNVTEDADLAVRLARAGWSSSVIDSTTWEEAPIHFGQWIRQRSRWLKGFAVTTAVHASGRSATELGLLGTLAVAAQLPATLVSAAAHPFGLWLILCGDLGDPTAIGAGAGYAVAVALNLAVAHRQGTPLWIAVLAPFYWLLQTVALVAASVDLVRSPTRWHKTAHGLVDRSGPAHALGEPVRAQGTALPEVANHPRRPRRGTPEVSRPAGPGLGVVPADLDRATTHAASRAPYFRRPRPEKAPE